MSSAIASPRFFADLFALRSTWPQESEALLSCQYSGCVRGFYWRLGGKLTLGDSQPTLLVEE